MSKLFKNAKIKFIDSSIEDTAQTAKTKIVEHFQENWKTYATHGLVLAAGVAVGRLNTTKIHTTVHVHI